MLNNLRLIFSARENILNNFKRRLFPIKNSDKISKPEPTPEVATEPKRATKAKTKRKILSLKMLEEFLNEIKNEEKIIIILIIIILVKYLYEDNQNKNGIILRDLKELLTDLRSSSRENNIVKKFLKMNIRKKLIIIVEEIVKDVLQTSLSVLKY